MRDPAVEALRRLVEITPGKRRAVADAIESSDQALYQIIEGVPLKSGKSRTVGRSLRTRLDRHFPGWMSLAASGDVAQSLTLQIVDTPPSVTWEAVMEAEGDDIPARFSVAMPDDALAPNVARGIGLLFERGMAPSPGVGVLVSASDGQRYVRRYAQGVGGVWLAQAINPAYASLESARDGLRILAVMTGRLDGHI